MSHNTRKKKCGYHIIPKLSKVLLTFSCFMSVSLAASFYGVSESNDIRSQLKSYEIDSSPWIGSHTLRFTPNPFLHQSKAIFQDPRDTSSSSDLFLIKSTAESPLSLVSTTNEPPIFPVLNDNQGKNYDFSSPPRKKKRKRKAKMIVKKRERKTRTNRSKLYDKKRFSQIMSKGNHLKLKPKRPKFIVPYPKASQNHEKVNKPMANEFNKATIQFLPIDKVSRNPVFMSKSVETTPAAFLESTPAILKSTSPSYITVEETPSASIKEENENPAGNDTNKVFLNYAINPDKLNPSYFRNMILKTMMDKLAKVGVVTHAPSLILRASKETETLS